MNEERELMTAEERTPLLKVEKLTKLFPVKKSKLREQQRFVHAVRGRVL